MTSLSCTRRGWRGAEQRKLRKSRISLENHGRFWTCGGFEPFVVAKGKACSLHEAYGVPLLIDGLATRLKPPINIGSA